MTQHITFFQAIVIGLLQGVTELFPVSSLGHSVLVPAWIGGDWQRLVQQESSQESPYLAFIVGLHTATALALLTLFFRDWVAIIKAFFGSIRRRRIETVHERLAWLLVVATIPAGILGLALEHALRTLFAKPLAAAIFLSVNGLLLIAGERLRRRSTTGAATGPSASTAAREASERTGDADEQALDAAIGAHVSVRDAGVIGVLQTAALFAGISRSGITMVGGLLRGLTHEEAVRFSFLLATPIIFAAGVYKVPDLFGPLGDGIRGQVLAGSAVAFVAAFASAAFLVRWFKTRTLTPFAIYCLVAGVASIVRFA
jgi:undecaprenyl-diphosphatase